MATVEGRKRRLGELLVICGQTRTDGTICLGQCRATSSGPSVTYYRCKTCLQSKKVRRPRFAFWFGDHVCRKSDQQMRGVINGVRLTDSESALYYVFWDDGNVTSHQEAELCVW